jgi:hypothetical protein
MNLMQIIDKYTTTEINPSTYGLSFYNDGPINICGSGDVIFKWFKKEEDLIEFIEKAFLSDLDKESLVNFKLSMISNVLHDEVALAKVQKILNDILKGFYQIQWIGEFQRLCAGENTYTKKVIIHFRESLGDDDESVTVNDAPIEKEEIALFKDYLEY